jgi:hypothetical protein
MTAQLLGCVRAALRIWPRRGAAFVLQRRALRVTHACAPLHAFVRCTSRTPAGAQKLRVLRTALALWYWDACGLGICDELGARVEVPLTPGCDHLDVRLQRIVANLKSDLIVALSGRAVAHRVRTALVGNFDLALGDQGPRDGRAQKIHALV